MYCSVDFSNIFMNFICLSMCEFKYCDQLFWQNVLPKIMYSSSFLESL